MPDLPPFTITDTTLWPVAYLEPGGSDEKVWLISPSSERALFKPNRPSLAADQGEDWAEKFSSELAELLGVPAARIELAERGGQRGCISYNVAPTGYDLQPGALLLDQLLGGTFDPERVEGHTIENIRRSLAGFAAPPGYGIPPTMTAFDVFCGYLMLDALIANRDRHSENWAVLLGRGTPDCIAPSYDHASALGFNLTDHRRSKMLSDSRMLEAFVRKGTAYRFAVDRKTTLVDICRQALSAAAPSTASHWLQRLDAIDTGDFVSLAARIPNMSDHARTLSIEVLIRNRRRLLDG